MTWRGRRVLLVCEQCDEIFSRRAVDARRFSHHFCGRACHADQLRTGRAMLEVICAGCSIHFPKVRWAALHDGRHYCTKDCYAAHVDRQALGHMGGSTAGRASPAARFLRSQKAGLARARNLTPEQLSEIGRHGAAVRVANGATRGPFTRRRALVERSWVSPLLIRQTDG